MASYSDGLEHESNAKRIKLDQNGSECGVMCDAIEFSTFPTSIGTQIEPCEDSDSGYEASTMESLPTSEENHTPSHPDTSQEEEDSNDADDDNASTVSELSGLSDLSGQDWKPMAGSMTWIQKQMQNGVNPRALLVDLGVELQQIPHFIDDLTLWKLIINMLSEPLRRHKLRHVNNLDDVLRLLKGAQKIIVLTGAGVSVSCGIPDFRSRDGIYSRLAIDFPDLPDPQAMFDISYFTQDPRPFFKFARDIFPGKFLPSPCHRFIKLLEKHNKLLRNYTQNIDTLEKVAEIERVIECHGSFATATCTKCGHKVSADSIRETVLAQSIPVCEMCWRDVGSTAIPIVNLKDREAGELRDLVAAGIMKPDIVFFGEGLPDSFHEAMSVDKNEADLLVVIGSSLKVRPVALIPSSLPANVPQILINREPLPHCHFDVELLGDCDVIINHLCQMLGANWEESVYDDNVLDEASHLLPAKEDSISSEKMMMEEEEGCTCSKDEDGDCECTLLNNKRGGGGGGGGDVVKSIKERHMSVDSARDSGIGDNSNFTDVDTVRDLDEYSSSEQQPPPLLLPKKIEYRDRDSFLNNYEMELSSNGFSDNKETSSSFSSPSTTTQDAVEVKNSFTDILDTTSIKQSTSNSTTTTTTTVTATAKTSHSSNDMEGYWQPKQKRSITERLPENTYFFIQPSRYIFPGAEVYYDPDDKCSYMDNTSSESSEEGGDGDGGGSDSESDVDDEPADDTLSSSPDTSFE